MADITVHAVGTRVLIKADGPMVQGVIIAVMIEDNATVSYKVGRWAGTTWAGDWLPAFLITADPTEGGPKQRIGYANG